MKIGLNLAAVATEYNASCQQFSNQMEQSSGFGTPGSPGFDADGYPLSVDPTVANSRVTTITFLNSIMQPGDYVLEADGVGTILLNVPPNVFANQPGWNPTIPSTAPRPRRSSPCQ